MLLEFSTLHTLPAIECRSQFVDDAIESIEHWIAGKRADVDRKGDEESNTQRKKIEQRKTMPTKIIIDGKGSKLIFEMRKFYYYFSLLRILFAFALAECATVMVAWGEWQVSAQSMLYT